MLAQLLITSGIMVGLVLAWVAVQALVRRSSGELEHGEDVLACRMCGVDGSCSCGLKAPTLDRKTSKDNEL